MVLRWSSCIRIRFITNSGASAHSARRSRTMLTITPPTGIPNSWNQPMKRLITAIGSASGSVTKKNAVRVASVRSWRACPIRVRNPSRYSSSGSASFFFVKDSISRSERASSRDFSILSTQSEYTLDMPRSRRAFAVGAVSKTYASYSSFSISSTMFSNMADSSNAGFIVADSTKSSAFVEMSANLRNHWIFSRISRLERSIVSRVSISYERSICEIREKIQWFLKFADISTKADDFVESATMNPAFEESAMFENMVELMLKNEYDAYV